MTKPDTLPLPNTQNTLLPTLRVLLLAMHIAGALGLYWPPSRPFFQMLAPFNLLFTAVVLLYFQEGKSIGFWAFAGISFLTGFFVEVLGVATGQIFGSYQYGHALGLHLWNVPLTIGLNWLILIYTIGILLEPYIRPWWLRALAMATLMVLTDVLIEPVAIQIDFWTWNSPSIPLQNYVAWWVVAFFLAICFVKMPFAKRNAIATNVYLCQLIFFALLNMLLYVGQ